MGLLRPDVILSSGAGTIPVPLKALYLTCPADVNAALSFFLVAIPTTPVNPATDKAGFADIPDPLYEYWVRLVEVATTALGYEPDAAAAMGFDNPVTARDDTTDMLVPFHA